MKCTAQLKFNNCLLYAVNLNNIRAVYTRENKPRLTLAAAYIIRERNYLYEYKLPDQDKPRLEEAVNVDFVPFIRGVRVLCKPRLIFSHINGPIKLCAMFVLKPSNEKGQTNKY